MNMILRPKGLIITPTKNDGTYEQSIKLKRENKILYPLSCINALIIRYCMYLLGI